MQDIHNICRYWAQHKVDPYTVEEERDETKNETCLLIRLAEPVPSSQRKTHQTASPLDSYCNTNHTQRCK